MVIGDNWSPKINYLIIIFKLTKNCLVLLKRSVELLLSGVKAKVAKPCCRLFYGPLI